jgi:hypothetical protein
MAPKELSREDFLLVFGPNDTYLAKAPGGILQSSLICSPEVTKMISSAKSFDYAVFEPLDTEELADAGEETAETESNSLDSESDVSGSGIATLITSGNEGTDPYLGWTKKDLPFSHKAYTPAAKYYPGLAEFLKKQYVKLNTFPIAAFALTTIVGKSTSK